jgi:hypothetical protein
MDWVELYDMAADRDEVRRHYGKLVRYLAICQGDTLLPMRDALCFLWLAAQAAQKLSDALNGAVSHMGEQVYEGEPFYGLGLKEGD